VHILPKLSSACYALRCMYTPSNIETIEMFCCAYFHLVIKYGITFTSNYTDNKGFFQLQKKTTGIRMGINSMISRSPISKALKILKVAAQYLLPLMAFVAHNLEHFIFTNSIYCFFDIQRTVHRDICGSFQEFCTLYVFSLKMNLFY
jgi:hypothetical protein